jgi:S-adenosylmethionine decarboxylase
MVKPLPRLKLQGFNNLTKSLSFNIYDVCYAVTPEQRSNYIEYIDEAYNAERLTQILSDVSEIIGANILNIARQDYDPQGASVTILISEQPVLDGSEVGKEVLKDAVVAHLDKSHITVHTYPENHPQNGLCTFRADIDVATCGVISPLKALNYLIDSFESDIVITDYRVRGATRDVKGRKHFIDHKINSIKKICSTRKCISKISIWILTCSKPTKTIFPTKSAAALKRWSSAKSKSYSTGAIWTNRILLSELGCIHPLRSMHPKFATGRHLPLSGPCYTRTLSFNLLVL